ncbi:MAG TPA: Leg1-related protein [Phototrophicaceae bacterium]|nr:Leg1-related protein [Phototrophicaceae bacterium]
MNQTYAQQLAQLDFYALWSALPTLTDSVDPFEYRGRMAVYKTLIEGMNGRGVFGAENELNVFWGYVFQLDWQRYSGRLTLASTPPDHIDPNSMWGYGNYTLSVIPYMAAAQLGIVPALEFLPPAASLISYPGGKGSAYTIPPIFDEALRVWREFFQFVQTFEPGKDIEPIRRLQWQAHHRSLDAAEAGVRALGAAYSTPSETDFLLGWIRMVDFLGSAAWRTDLIYMLENGVGTLPERMLTASDVPGAIADMDSRVNNNIRNIIGLTKQSKLRFDINLYLWKRAMRTRQARDEVLPMLDASFNPSPENVNERRKLLRYMIAL